jgi:cell division protein FtsQ
MARNAAISSTEPLFGDIRWGRFAFWLVAGLICLAGTIFAWYRLEDFLIKDDRFRLTQPDEYHGQSPNLIMEGIHYASTSQIRHVFAEDLGRSLYLVPIQKRREQLLAIDWVESATVAKIWPNTLKVRIGERVPVAFVRLASNRHDGASQFALTDKDGMILRPRVAAKFTLPVVSGIRESESLEDRRARIHRVLAMLRELGGLAGQISEINVNDPNDLIVSEHIDDNVLNLMLGEENFAERMQNFLANYSEIRRKRPDVKTLDLRVDGIITAVGEDTSGK